jgi:putative endopeptidase
MNLQDEITSTIKPGDDFYNFVNKNWCEAHPIPADKARYAAFTVLEDIVTNQLRTLLESPIAGSESRNSVLAKKLYASGIDEATRHRRGLDPILPIVAEIEKIQGSLDAKAFVAQQHGVGIGLLWSLGFDIDDKDSQRYTMITHQAGLLLPNRDYYFEEGKRFETVRIAYKAFLRRVFELLGKSHAAKRVDNVYAIEEKLAEASNTSVENRDADAKYNPYTFQELAREFTGFDWTEYRHITGLSEAEGLVVHQPKFLKQAIDLLNVVPVDVWKDYFIAHSIVPNLQLLSKDYDDLYFELFGKVLTGIEVQEDRYKRIIRDVTAWLPEPIGQLYVEAHFDESAKAVVTDLVCHIQTAVGERIKKLTWMSDVTKQKALEKLDTFVPLLGYPDTWRSYDALELTDNYFENIFTIRRFEWHYDVKRITRPVDRREWLMSPAAINAYYWPNTNGITFPAALLQPPFFDANGDFAANYGGIGMVIGHEITHGFDDNGSKYDKIGNLESWWTDDDRKAFEERTKTLVDQYDVYAIGGQHVKGQLTLGENIADLGGMLVAYDAMQEKLVELREKNEVDGFTPEQRFFMAQARVWRMNIRPELALQLLVIDSHAPVHLRVNGVVTNVDAWYDSWGITESNTLYKPSEQRVQIW